MKFVALIKDQLLNCFRNDLIIIIVVKVIVCRILPIFQARVKVFDLLVSNVLKREE